VAINFTGEFTAPRSPEEVFEFLADPNRFGPLLPDFESMTVQDATHFTVKVRVGVGNIRGTAEIKMELAEATRPQRAVYKGHGTAVGSQITIRAGFDLSPMPESTRVAWQGEANVFGKLASMAGGMLEPLAKKNIQKLIDGLRRALSTQRVEAPVAVAQPVAAVGAAEKLVPAAAPPQEAVAEKAPQAGGDGSHAQDVIPSDEVVSEADDRGLERPL
jgi:carbon monoxide dehydrogenase subunit G